MRYLIIGLLLLAPGGVSADDRPNVILILTDDQGYGTSSGPTCGDERDRLTKAATGSPFSYAGRMAAWVAVRMSGG